MQSALSREGGVERVWSRSERRTEGIADRLENVAVMRLNRLPKEGIVAGESSAHGFRILLPEPGAALDVREEEGNGTGWRVHSGSVGLRHSLRQPEEKNLLKLFSGGCNFSFCSPVNEGEAAR